MFCLGLYISFFRLALQDCRGQGFGCLLRLEKDQGFVFRTSTKLILRNADVTCFLKTFRLNAQNTQPQEDHSSCLWLHVLQVVRALNPPFCESGCEGSGSF